MKDYQVGDLVNVPCRVIETRASVDRSGRTRVHVALETVTKQHGHSMRLDIDPSILDVPEPAESQELLKVREDYASLASENAQLKAMLALATQPARPPVSTGTVTIGPLTSTSADLTTDPPPDAPTIPVQTS